MHAIVRDAAQGSAAVSKFIATRFDLADEYEAAGRRADADTMRETWTAVLTSLSTVDRAIAAETSTVAEPALA